MKLSRSTSLLASVDLTNTEEFVVFYDQFQKMTFRPLRVSELWRELAGDDWWYLWEERSELSFFIRDISVAFRDFTLRTGDPVAIARLGVDYSFRVSEGASRLGAQWGAGLACSPAGVMVRACMKAGKHAELRFVTGFVRTITMNPFQ